MGQISVIQPGARLHYAVPEIFARAGLLKRLYTDLHAEHRWLRALELLVPDEWQPKQLRRLLGRRLPPDLPAGLVDDISVETLLRHAADRFGLPKVGQRHLSKRILRSVEAASLGRGDVVYTVLVNDDLETMKRLKERGVRIIHECMIAPDVGLWVQEERRLYQGFEVEEEPSVTEAGRLLDREKYALADLVLAPSDFVRRAILELGCAPEKIKLVPYGLSLSKYSEAPNTKVGQVLFVGTVGLRKGAQYLAAAARTLGQRHRDITVRVVGPVPEKVATHPVFAGPTYVGQVPRSTVFAEYRQADVFVLPTICEGCALVHLEAMAAGVPVITTPNCGSVVRDGVDGYIVPVRDSDAIAERVERIVFDRQLRAEMSANARARAQQFSIECYGERLLDAIKPVLN